jgi:repressor LexA
MFASSDERSYDRDMVDKISPRQREILGFIESQIVDRGYPPSVREIGEAVGLTSPSTVHTHLNTLERLGFIRRDPTKPRAIEVRWDSNSGVAMERRPVRHVPLVGDVAAGTDVLAQENVEEILPLPQDFTGDGELFMLRVRGESMVDLGIFDGDYIVASQQPKVLNGDIAVVGIPGGEATVKTYRRDGDTVTLIPANIDMEPMTFPASEVELFGRAVTVLRRL